MELAQPGDTCVFDDCGHDFANHPKVRVGSDVVMWPCTVEGCKCGDFGVVVEVVEGK